MQQFLHQGKFLRATTLTPIAIQSIEHNYDVNPAFVPAINKFLTQN